MKIFLGADHGGFSIKEQLKEQLKSHDYLVEDCGAMAYDATDDYPVYARQVAEAVAGDAEACGILLCRSGHGMVMAANKVAGARAALATTPAWTNQSRTDDGANILAFGVDFSDNRQILSLALGWLKTDYAGGRHQRRLDELTAMEQPR